LGQAELGTNSKHCKANQNIFIRAFLFSEKPSAKSAEAMTKGIKRPKRKGTHKTPCCEASEGILLRRKGLAGEEWQGRAHLCEQVRTKGISKVESGLFALFPRRLALLRFKLLNSQCLAISEASKESTSSHWEKLQINVQTCQCLDGYLQGCKMFNAIRERVTCLPQKLSQDKGYSWVIMFEIW